jgi:hypothetical protein
LAAQPEHETISVRRIVFLLLQNVGWIDSASHRRYAIVNRKKYAASAKRTIENSPALKRWVNDEK